MGHLAAENAPKQAEKVVTFQRWDSKLLIIL
jgi:hypothetical protein